MEQVGSIARKGLAHRALRERPNCSSRPHPNIEPLHPILCAESRAIEEGRRGLMEVPEQADEPQVLNCKVIKAGAGRKGSGGEDGDVVSSVSAAGVEADGACFR